MNYRYLKGTGIQLSQVTLGSSTFGDQLDQEGSFQILSAALEAGINSIDTGDVYCGGESERIIGQFLQKTGCRREIVLATKMGLATGAGGVNNQRASRFHIFNALDASLRRLQTDYIDLYYIHHPDRNTPMEETLDTLDALVRSGKVRYVGFSNYSAWEACDLVWTAKERRLVPPVVAQNVYNLITRGLEPEFAPFVQKHQMGLVVYNPLAGGLLTGKHTRYKLAEGTRYASKMYQERYCNDENFTAIEALTEIASQAGISLLEMAVRFAFSRPYIDSVLMGFSKTAQLEQNLALLEKGPLSQDLLEACDVVWKKRSGGTVFPYFIPAKGAVGVTYSGSLK